MIDPLTAQARAESIENRHRPLLEMTRDQKDQLRLKLERLFATTPHRFVPDEPGRPRPERVQVSLILPVGNGDLTYRLLRLVRHYAV